MKHQILKNSGKLLRPLTFSLIFWNPLRFMDLPQSPSPFLPLFALMKFMSSLKVSHFVFVASSVDGKHGAPLLFIRLLFGERWGEGDTIDICSCVFVFQFQVVCNFASLVSIFFFLSVIFFIERIICKQFSR